MEDNIGIKIAVAAGSRAKCVFPGEVTRIAPSSDGTKTVIVRHGTYFTIYSNLQSTSVAPGQKIAAGATIGTIAEDYDGTNTLDFQVWQGQTPMDPLNWISR